MLDRQDRTISREELEVVFNWALLLRRETRSLPKASDRRESRSLALF